MREIQNRPYDTIRHLKDKIERVENRIAEMKMVQQHCLDCNNTDDALHVQMKIAPLTVKLASLREQLYRVEHPNNNYAGSHITINNNKFNFL